MKMGIVFIIFPLCRCLLCNLSCAFNKKETRKQQKTHSIKRVGRPKKKKISSSDGREHNMRGQRSRSGFALLWVHVHFACVSRFHWLEALSTQSISITETKFAVRRHSNYIRIYAWYAHMQIRSHRDARIRAMIYGSIGVPSCPGLL